MNLLQSLFAKPPKPSTAEIQQQLMVAFHFTDEDLQANRQGRMSSEQHYWFVDRFLRTALISIGILALVVAFLSTAHLPDEHDPILRIGIILFAFLVFITVNWHMLVDVVLRKMGVVSGKGHVYIQILRSDRVLTRYYMLQVENMRFDISKAVSKIIIDDEFYTVHYALHSHIILAIEIQETDLT